MRNKQELSDINYLLTEAEVGNLYSSEYWNDLEAEKKKDWWIADGDYDKCWKYLNTSGTLSELEDSLRHIKPAKSNDLIVADFAAGIGWASAIISKEKNVKEVHALEMSKHRLELFEDSTKMFEGDAAKIKRYFGSFYDSKFDDSFFDIILLNQAFHHADEPFKLLQECKRIIKPNGLILIVGEPYIGVKAYCRRFLTLLIKERKFKYKFYDLFKTCPEMGDHYYRDSDYKFIFQSAGFESNFQLLRTGNGFYLLKNL